MGPWRLSLGTLGAGPHGPLAAIARDQGAQPQSARRLGRASVLGPGRLENLIRKSNQIIYCLIKLTVTPPYPPHGGSPGPWQWGALGKISSCCDVFWHLGVIHFFIDFSLPFLIDLGSIFLPNLPPKIH